MRPKSGRSRQGVWRTTATRFADDEQDLIRKAARDGQGNLIFKTLAGQTVAYRFSRGETRFLLIDPLYQSI